MASNYLIVPLFKRIILLKMIKKLYSLILMVFIGFSALAQPTVAAPDPTVAPANVISLFSNVYTNVPVNTWRTSWSNATLADVQIAMNDTKLYTNLDFVGIEFVGANTIDATTMQYYHVDVWTPNATVFRVKLVDFGADGAFGGGDDKEHEYVVPTLTLAGWNSYDIPLSAFTGLTTKAHLAQMIFSALPTANATAYVDNVYFYNVPNAPILTNFTIPAQVVGAPNVTITAPTSNSPGTFTYTSSNTSVATIAGDVITILAAGTSTITATQAAAGGFLSGIITTPLVVSVGPPMVAAPTPAQPAANVISLFSNAYTNVPVNTWRTSWSNATLADVQIAMNDTKLYTNLDFVGIEFVGGNMIDATAMQFYHIDIWTPNATVFRVKLVDFGADGAFGGGDDREHEYVVPTLTLAGWNSYDIPLSAFTGLTTRAHLAQMIFSALPTANATVYADNVYFYNVPNAPILTNFTIPAQVVGAPNVTITAPTSNSTGAFTYTSSNTSVATIAGDVITILAAGTSTITATQAAAGGFSSGIITTPLVVSVGPPMVAAPTPIVPLANVISLFSNAYTNVPVNTWRTSWSNATLADVQIAMNDTKLYTNLDFVGIEFVGANTIDATTMQYYHVDVWTPNATVFRVKLVDFGADGGFGGGDDREHEYVMPTLTLAGWNSYDIPLSAFTGLTTRAHLAQMIFSALPTANATVYLDNVYFSSSNPLPITLSNFTATKNKNIVNLQWNTLSELNNKGFDIEKSTDGVNYNSIGFVKGNINSTSKTSYNLIDTKPVLGNNYYRLKQIDVNGRFTNSSVEVVKFTKSDLLSFTFFPNPTKDVLKINVGLIENSNATIKLMNVMGQMIISKIVNKATTTTSVNFDVSMLKAGVYYIELTDGATKNVEKVVIN
jgi:Secretion system C-terminal sorting domain